MRLAVFLVLLFVSPCSAQLYPQIREHIRTCHGNDQRMQLAASRLAGEWHSVVLSRGGIWSKRAEREFYWQRLPSIGVNPTQCFQGNCPQPIYAPPSGGGLSPVPVPVPEPPAEQPKPQQPTITDEDLQKIADILWQRMLENPDKFKGDPGLPGAPGKRGPKGDSIEGLTVEFLDQNMVEVPEMRQEVTTDNPVIRIPPALLNLNSPDDPSQAVTVGAPLGNPIYLQQRWRGDE